MQSLKNYNPIKFLDDYRDKDFHGEWPTLVEMLKITVKRFGERNAFTDWDTDDGSKRTYSYNEVFVKVEKLAKWFVQNGVEKGDKTAKTRSTCKQYVRLCQNHQHVQGQTLF